MTPIKPAAGRVLVVGSSDATRQAGLQTDIEAVAALGGQAAIAVAALVTRDAHGVAFVHDVPAAFLRMQLLALTADSGTAAFKTGLLGDAARIEVVAETVAQLGRVPFVLDPAMADWPCRLQSDAVASLKRSLMPLASVITPSVAEAEALSGMTVATVDDMQRVAEMLLTLGASAVLLRGGRLPGDKTTDVLATDDGTEIFTSAQVGRTACASGCRIASAIATGLAQGLTVRDAVVRARAYVQARSPMAPASMRTPAMARG